MTTTTSKSVPRSRLNITYRTRIDGRVVQKELPLRLLVAANFSGRGMKGPFGNAVPGRDLPMLDRRPMYAIGKSGTLESVMKLMRIGLPVPDQLTHFRSFRVSGYANVMITRGGDDVTLVQLQQAEIEGAARPGGAGSADAGSADPGGADADGASPDYRGQLQSFLAVEFSSRQADGKTIWAPKNAGEPNLSGWLEPKRQTPREPAIMYEVTGLDELALTFEADDFDVSLVPQGGVERRVRLEAIVTTRHVIPLLDMKSFEPERIAETVPEIRRLLVLRWLVSQGRSMIASNPILRNKCKGMLPGSEQATPAEGAAAGAGEEAGASPLAMLRDAVAALDAQDVFRLRPSTPKDTPQEVTEDES